MSEQRATSEKSQLFCASGLEVIDGSTPWLDPGLLPEKPQGFLFGVRLEGHPKLGDVDQPCGSEEELEAVLFKESKYVNVVYLPDHDYGVPRLSLNRYRPWEKVGLRRLFVKTLVVRGTFAGCAIAAAIMIASEQSIEKSLLLFIAALLFGIVPVFDHLIQWLIYPKSKPLLELKQSMVHGSLFYDWIGKAGRSKALIWSMLAILVIVYFGQWKSGLTGMINPELVKMIHRDHIRQDGEWWRMITGSLMHGAEWHIAMNSLGLYYLGKFIHRLSFPLMVPITFVVSAFFGALASAIWSPGPGTVGASGGVVGMIGFLTVLALLRRKELPYDFRSSMIKNILLLAIIGVVGILFIDNAGHAGGFVGGTICGLIYQPTHRNQWDVPTTPLKAVMGTVSIAILVFGLACCMDLFFYNGEVLTGHLPRFPW